MAGPDEDRRAGAPSHIHIERDKQPGWLKALAWLALIAGILALLLALSRCHRDDTAAVAPAGNVVAETPTAPQSAAAVAGTSGLGAYLAGSQPAPQTFTFEKINFDTAKSDIRSADASEVDRIAGVLKQYPTAKIRVAGYADARGSDPANQALGKARADSIKSALVAKGVDGSRIESVSGGETDPVASNATPSGQFENRRTELVVTAR